MKKGEDSRPLYYNTGQGMGLYSSWASLAFTNHAIVKLSAHEVGLHHFEDYLVLGDDVVIANKEVSEKYLQIITDLGVSIRIPKSVVPMNGLSGAEFASRLFVQGKDLRPLPLGPILEPKRVQSLFQLWTVLQFRCTTISGFNQEYCTSPDLGPSIPLSGREELKSL